MEPKILQPTQKVLNQFGKMSYGESVRAWNTIRLKKDIINEFSNLKEKTSNFIYNLIFYRTYEELELAIRKMKKEKKPLPMLLFLQKIN